MTRASQTLSLGLLAASVYIILLWGLVPFPQKIQEELIPVLPFWVLISFGAFLLGKLGWGVLTFNDVPEAHEELQKEIEQARADLKKRGVEVD